MKKIVLIYLASLSSLMMGQTAVPVEDSILSDGIYRKYTIYVPTMYNLANSVPLVLNIHGGSGSGNQQMDFANFTPIADTANFIIVSPTALLDDGSEFGTGTPTNLWVTDWTTEEGKRDKRFLFNLINSLKSFYNIDSNRIYSTGFSQGGITSYNFACFENIDFAAVGIVAGGMFINEAAPCLPIRPTPICIIHGTTDLIATYDGSPSQLFGGGGPTHIHTDSAVQFWVDYNKCNTVPTVTTLTESDSIDNSTVEHYVYSDGNQGVSVEFFKVTGGGHSWPAVDSTGGTRSPSSGNVMTLGNRNRDLNTCKELWRFFSQQKLTNITSIDNDIGRKSNIVVYPNPSNGLFTLKVEEMTNETSFQLYDILGQVIYQSAITNPITSIDLRWVPSGIYTYQVKRSSGSVDSGKLVLE